MRRVGLTGGIASGKTAVSDLLAAHGAVIIDADLLAREVVEPTTPGFEAVVEHFTDAVVAPDGTLDRAALGAVVFGNSSARKDLEAIIHPAVRARAAEIEAASAPDATVVHVVPLLVETGQAESFDVVVVVDVEPATQLERLQLRSGLSDDDARRRVAAQASPEVRLAVADYVVDNNGSSNDLAHRVAQLWQEVRSVL